MEALEEHRPGAEVCGAFEAPLQGSQHDGGRPESAGFCPVDLPEWRPERAVGWARGVVRHELPDLDG
jgi:hypothetical protein